MGRITMTKHNSVVRIPANFPRSFIILLRVYVFLNEVFSECSEIKELNHRDLAFAGNGRALLCGVMPLMKWQCDKRSYKP